MLIYGMGLIGDGNTPTNPVPVTNLSLTGASNSSLTLNFTPPPSGSIVWNVRVSGTLPWLAASGNFSSNFAVITGLNPSTSYDVQAIATNNGGTATAQITGVSTLATVIVPSPISGLTNRFDLTLSLSTVAPGNAVTWSLTPNAGAWPGGGNIVITPSNGDAIITVAVPSSGNAVLTGTYSPSSAGEISLTATNNAGLYNPYPAPLTVFTPGAGVAATIAVSSARADQGRLQRDVAIGAPSGFTGSWIKGWGESFFSINVSGSALFVRLYDSLSTGATAAQGSGTAVTGVVQVHGAFNAGVNRVLLPAGPYIYYAEFATDAAFTNPVRVAQRFGIGVVIGHFSRSQECGLARPYNDSMTFPLIYGKTASWCSQDHRYAMTSYNGAAWFLQDGIHGNPYPYESGEITSSGAQEIGRLIENYLGVVVGVTGTAEAGGNFDDMVAHDGSLCGGFTGTVAESVGNKFRYFWADVSDWTGYSDFPSETHAENKARYLAAVNWIAKNYPSCAVQGWCTAASGQFGSDGSRAVGYTRNQTIFLKEIEPFNAMVVSKECYGWNEYVGNHASMAARKDYVRPGFRKLMAAEIALMGGLQTSARGPVLASAGTYNASARTITIPFSIASGAQLQAVGVSYSNPNSTITTASSAELACLFAVYVAGGYQGNGTAIKISGATFDNTAKTVTLTLVGSTGVTFADNTTAAAPNGFSVQFAADFGASNSTVTPGNGRGIMLTDDRISSDGIPYGWHMLPALDIAIANA